MPLGLSNACKPNEACREKIVRRVVYGVVCSPAIPDRPAEGHVAAITDYAQHGIPEEGKTEGNMSLCEACQAIETDKRGVKGHRRLLAVRFMYKRGPIGRVRRPIVLYRCDDCAQRSGHMRMPSMTST